MALEVGVSSAPDLDNKILAHAPEPYIIMGHVFGYVGLIRS